MKISVSLGADDVAMLDRYVEQAGLPSRSAGIQEAIRLLRDPKLEADYAAAWDEWAQSEVGADWESTVGDGLNQCFVVTSTSSPSSP